MVTRDEEDFLKVYLIAKHKLEDITNLILSNPKDITFKKIMDYWNYHDKYYTTCPPAVDIILKDLKKEGIKYII